MKIIFTLLSFALSASSAFAQYPPLSWAKTINGISPYGAEASIEDVDVDNAGHAYVCGFFIDTLVADQNFPDNLLAGETENSYIAKYDQEGTLIWVKYIPWVKILDLCLDIYDNVFITGKFFDATIVDFDPSDNIANLNVGNAGMFFAKYDTDGNYLMAKALAMTGNFPIYNAHAIHVDGNSNIYVGGSFRIDLDLDPGPETYYINNPNQTWNCNDCPIGFYAKYDSTGAFLWGDRELGSYQINAIAVDDLTGRVSIGGSVGTPFRLLTAEGVTLHFSSNGGYGYGAFATTFDEEGNLYYAGSYHVNSGDFDWGPGSTDLASTGFGDSRWYLAKYDVDGILMWVAEYDYDGTSFGIVTDVDLDFSSDGNLLMAYSFSNGGTPVVGYGKINTQSGAMIWTSNGLGLGVGTSYTANVASDIINNTFYITGNFGYSEVPSSFDGDPSENIYMVNGTGRYGLFEKYGECLAAPGIPGEIAGVAALCSSGEQIYSVPSSSDVVSYTWLLPVGWTGNSTTNTITASPSTNGGIITLIANNVCGASASRTLEITYTAPPTINIDASDNNICAGSSITLNATGPDNVAWNNDVINLEPFAPELTLTYVVTGTTLGCSSLDSVTVTVHPTYLFMPSEFICQGEIYTFPDGTTAMESMEHTSVYISQMGCDSLIQTTLTVLPSYAINEEYVICESSYILPDGTTVSADGTYASFLQTDAGCDSTFQTALTFVNFDNITMNGIELIAPFAESYQWINCDTGVEINGAIQQVFAPEVTGNYSVVVFANGCLSDLDCVYIEIIGVNENALPHVQLYPNPVNDQLYIQTNNIRPNALLQIYRSDGTIADVVRLNAAPYSYDASALGQGVYYLMMDGKSIGRIVKM